MYQFNNANLSRLARRICSTMGVGVALVAFTHGASASCTYSIDSEWDGGFVASITIKNDTSAPINNWNVSWQYATNRAGDGWNANLSGSNPYSASNLAWNGAIPVGQSVSFGFQGTTNGASAERPAVTGTACNSGATSSISSAPSSASSSSTPASSALIIQEAQAGFCRVDGSVDNDNGGFTGSGFANTNNVLGAAVVWAVQAASSGRHTLTFRIANGGTANRNGALLINGGSNGNYTVSLPVTGNWTTWQDVSIAVDLVQGNNRLELSALTAEGLPNIDYLGVAGGNVSAGNCSGTGNSSSSAASSSAPSQSCALPNRFSWTSTPPLISPQQPNWASVKDPSIVRYNGLYHVFATVFDTSTGSDGSWGSMYMNFADWSQAGTATQKTFQGTAMGNAVAPQVFYFRPHNRWYQITQWGGAYSTTTDITNPASWSPKQRLLQGEPSGALDFWVICDDSHCYLFFSRDDGVLYMSKTTIGNFPNFSGYTVVMRDHRGDGKSFLFEAVNVYKVDGFNQYLLLVEAYHTPGYGPRYFRSWTAPSLDGPWTALADTEANPFAGENNVQWPQGKWSRGISHGELVRSGYDERLTIDPCNLELLYQGEAGTATSYGRIPYKLGLLRLNK